MTDRDELSILQDDRAAHEIAAGDNWGKICGLLITELGPNKYTAAMDLIQAYGKQRANSEKRHTQITHLLGMKP